VDNTTGVTDVVPVYAGGVVHADDKRLDVFKGHEADECAAEGEGCDPPCCGHSPGDLGAMLLESGSIGIPGGGFGEVRGEVCVGLHGAISAGFLGWGAVRCSPACVGAPALIGVRGPSQRRPDLAHPSRPTHNTAHPIHRMTTPPDAVPFFYVYP